MVVFAVVVFAAGFFAVVVFAVVVFAAAVFAVVVFVAAFVVAFFAAGFFAAAVLRPRPLVAGPRSRRSCSSSRARSIDRSSTASPLRSDALVSPSVT